MPVLFCAHGSPMNALADNNFTLSMNRVGEEIPRPKAILCISAHWTTKGTFLQISPNPKMIYDMYGFPPELYKVNYPASGSPETAQEIMNKISVPSIFPDSDWGFDHGCWSILKHLFPKADIPVFELSINYYQPIQFHYDLAKQLTWLRMKGILIIGSGNITHNLQKVNFSNEFAAPSDWTQEFDSAIKHFVDTRNHKSLIEYEKIGTSAKLSIPEPSHYIPLIYAAALDDKNEEISYFYEGFEYETLSMRCIKFG